MTSGSLTARWYYLQQGPGKHHGVPGPRWVIGGLLLVLAIVAIAVPGGATGDDESEPYPTRQLAIMAPAGPGGGWDTTARAFQASSRDAKLDDGIEVYNVEGAGGVLGLSQLVSKDHGDPYELMMTGLVMLGAIETNGSDIKLTRATPIATLITETEAIVVPAKSKYRSMRDLADALKRDPGSVRVAGGSAGGTDQLLAGELTRTVGGDPKAVRYVAHSGGGEANAAILSGSVDAGITGLSEIVDQVDAGKMRLLAVSSPVDVEIKGRKLPTLKDEGIDLELTNWRAMFAPPGITDSERRRITEWVVKVTRTPSWKKNVERYDWTEFVRSGRDLDAFLASEQARVEKTIDELGIGQ
jgi:putative tricarboxylic transport membrane protein